ncbi:MAG: DUF4340 domain-containing protein, partial [Verrucomicrobiaceae bacterium]
GTIELRKGNNNEWLIEKPVKDRADSMAVSQLFTTLETLRHDSTFPAENKDQLKEFGVSESNTKVRLTGEGQKEVELLLGKDAAVEGKTYVRAQGSDTIYVIGNDLKTQLNKKADEFRDRKLATLTTQEVNRLVIATKDGEIELEKKDNHWMIIKPMKARGDDQKINDLIATTTTAQIDQFLTDSSNLANYGLTEPRGTVSFFTEGKEKPVVLQIGTNGKEEKDKEKTFAKLSTRDSVVLVPKEIEKILEPRPNDLRDRNLVRFEADIVDRITIEGSNKPPMVLSRKGESWVRKDGDKEVPVNEVVPSRLLTDLKSTEVTNFVADTASDLQKYGLDQPQLKVTLSSYASENTPETKAGDKPIVAVLFGNVEGDHGYAKIDDEPFVVAVPKSLLESVPTDPIHLQELTIFTNKPEEVSALELVREGQTPLSLEKTKEGAWKLAKGDGSVNQANVQSLVNTLSGLRAVRWVGATTAEHGFEKPTAVATFITGEGDKKVTRKLTLGTSTPDDVFYAIAEGLTGTFAISKPDRDAFDLALIEKPAQPQTQVPVPPMVQPNTPPVAPNPAAPAPTTPDPAPPAAPAP